MSLFFVVFLYLFDDSSDPDVNVFNVNFKNLNAPYLFPEEFKNFLDNSSPSNYFSILNLNIKSIKKNFELMKSINFIFSVIWFSEIWLHDLNITRDSLYELPNYTSNHQIRSDRKGGGVSVYIHNMFDFKVRANLSANNIDIEAITVEIVSNKKRNTLINALYRTPRGKIEAFEIFLNSVFSQTKNL